MEETTSWWDSIFNTVGTKVGMALDFNLNEWLGLPNSNTPIYGLGSNPYPEQVAPTNPNPTEQGFVMGNNTPTYALGAGLLLLGLVAYKAFK